MADFQETDLPATLTAADLMIFSDGTTIRFETNGEARDIMVGDDFNAAAQLFPGAEHVITAGGRDFRITTGYEDNITITAI